MVGYAHDESVLARVLQPALRFGTPAHMLLTGTIFSFHNVHRSSEQLSRPHNANLYLDVGAQIGVHALPNQTAFHRQGKRFRCGVTRVIESVSVEPPFSANAANHRELRRQT
jgi:hypothetical protein